MACEVAYRFPDYLAFFNAIGGGPARAYRRLVDSSLDWGQDLPGVRRYIDEHRLDEPLYLSYFGTASPAYYGILARPLRSYPNWDEEAAPALRVIELPRDQAEGRLADFLRHLPDYEAAPGGPLAEALGPPPDGRNLLRERVDAAAAVLSDR
jgi:hypothetical protein